MYRIAFLISATLLTTSFAPAPVAAQAVDGTWKLTYLSGSTEYDILLVKLKTEDSKITGEVISPKRRKQDGDGVRHLDGLLHIDVTNGNTAQFEAIVPKQPTKRILGSWTVNAYSSPAWLTPTDEKRLGTTRDTRSHVCPPLQEALDLRAKASALRAHANAQKGSKPTVAERQALLKKAEEADAFEKKETPALYREVLKEYPDDPVIFTAIHNLLASASKNGVKLEEVKGWAATADRAAKAYGPRFEISFATVAATVLADQEEFAQLAVDYARRVQSAQNEKTPAENRIAALNLLGKALKKAGDPSEAKKVDEQIAKIEEGLDREYAATMPPFKGEAFAGRKAKSERVVLLERFTNTADRNFAVGDWACAALQATFKSNELVVLQYHQNFTHGDPLANADCDARLAYFRKAFPIEFAGKGGSKGGGTVSTSLLNGLPEPINIYAGPGLDGALKMVEPVYKSYRTVIEPLLEDDSLVKLAAKAERKGDQIDIHVTVSGLAKPGPKRMLRMVLTEEGVRYLGANKVRLHQNVVRAFPGGVAGQALTEASSKHNLTISVKELRTQLNKYLEENASALRTVKGALPSIALDRLRVTAFVQDDRTREVLQTVQVEVQGK